MKICFLHKFVFQMPRIIEKLIPSLANEFAALGDEVTIVSVRGRLALGGELDNRVRVINHDTMRYTTAKALVPSYMDGYGGEQFDLMVLFYADMGEAHTPTMQRMLRNQPFIIYLCYPLRQAPQQYLAFKNSELAAAAAALVSDTEANAAPARNYFGRPVKVIPVGINPLTYYPNRRAGQQLRQTLSIDMETKVLLTVAPLEPKSGIETVLHTLATVRRHIPNLEYIVAGRGEGESELTVLAEQLGVSDMVCFVGLPTNLLPYYNMADAFVLMSSDKEPPIACLEAMACARPVIVTSNTVFSQLVPRGCGWRVPRDDNVQIAETIVATLQQSYSLTLGVQARHHVLRHYTWTARALELRQFCASFTHQAAVAALVILRGVQP